MIDLRSDTLTKPTPAMRDAMFSAEVGDDVFGEDPTINALEHEVAEMMGMEDALFCASGTMCNQIAIIAHTRPGDHLICYENAHVYLYEGGGVATNAGVTVRTIASDLGILQAADIEKHINADDPHFPKTSLVCIENTVNKGGGACWSLEEIEAVSKLCHDRGLKLHMDGARFMNAVVARGYRPDEVGPSLDSISICLSKGLGAPVGSVLAGTKEFIYHARRIRKRLGGGMRQAGFLAAAGRYALKHHVGRLSEDHAGAKRIGEALEAASWVRDVMPIETNIVIFRPKAKVAEVLTQMETKGILGVPFGSDAIRFVVHLDITSENISEICEKIPKFT
ncbi:MAG: low specificity L-threonine aldolase [Bacteroidia bacterium]